MRVASRMFMFVVCLILASAAPSFAQDTALQGVVRDSSGAVVPGVTVEASSPALIEKSRTAVTDGSGQYRIIALVPGIYTVTFSLEGFSKVERTGIELRAETTLPVNADLRVGALQETVTVTGASPIVDLQTVSAVTVMTREILDVAPISRNLQTVGILIPGTGLTSSAQTLVRDVGGSSQGDQYPLTYRGSGASVTAVDGMRVSVVVASGQYGLFQNDAAAQEISYNTGADSAEMGQAGLRVNVVPREGGNSFKGSISTNYTGGDFWNADNCRAPAFGQPCTVDSLKGSGITNVGVIWHIYDFNPLFGGPIKRDRLWFLTTPRWLGVTRTAADTYYDGDPNPFRYSPDLNRPGYDDSRQTSFSNRLTWKVSDKNKVTGYVDKQTKYIGHIAVSSTNLPEASTCQCLPYQWVGNAKWTSTLTNRLLFEGGWGLYNVEWDYIPQKDVPGTAFRINDQTTGRTFNAPAQSKQQNISSLHSYTAKLTWVTGTHSLSGGLNGNLGSYDVITVRENGDVSQMRFGQIGIGAPGADETGYGPNQVSLALPTRNFNKINFDNGFWVTDRMTFKRATITAGLRFDWFKGSWGPSSILPNKWSEAKDFSPNDALYSANAGKPNWRDLSPRLGFAYDLFGNGKTALKVGASKYLNAETVNTSGALNPINTLSSAISLTWTDLNGDHTIFNGDGTVQDKDLRNGNPTQDELAPIPASSTFGQLVTTTTITDPKTRSGYGVRGYSWEFSVGIQQELMPRVALNFNYYRRPTAGNRTETDNINIGPSNYNGPYCVTTPTDPRLPGNGGQQLCGIYQQTQESLAIATQNLVTYSATHVDSVKAADAAAVASLGVPSKPTIYNHGFDLTINARTTFGTTIQGGINGDKSISNTCYQALLGSPQTLQVNPTTGRPNCDVRTPLRPDLKMIGTQDLHFWGLQAAATYQHVLGPQQTATWTISQATANANGWNITTAAGSTAAQIAAATTNFGLLQTGQQYGKALDQLDVRFSKRLNLSSGKRLLLNFDVYNVFNAAWVYGQNNTFGTNSTVSSTWLRPSSILSSRQMKVGGQFDF